MFLVTQHHFHLFITLFTLPHAGFRLKMATKNNVWTPLCCSGFSASAVQTFARQLDASFQPSTSSRCWFQVVTSLLIFHQTHFTPTSSQEQILLIVSAQTAANANSGWFWWFGFLLCLLCVCVWFIVCLFSLFWPNDLFIFLLLIFVSHFWLYQ